MDVGGISGGGYDQYTFYESVEFSKINKNILFRGPGELHKENLKMGFQAPQGWRNRIRFYPRISVTIGKTMCWRT